MSGVVSILESGLHEIVEISTMLMEFIGVFILVSTAVRCFYRWLRHDSSTRLMLAQGIALSLEFKMGGELLRTVSVREWNELLILGAIILLRAALTFLIHWEIGMETRKVGQPDGDRT